MRLVVLLLMLLFLIPIILVLLFFIKLFLKGKNEGWRGTIIDKIYNQSRGDDDSMENFYSFKIKTDEGKERKIAVTSAFYAECKIGDKIEKPKGKIFPVKLS